MAAGKSSGKPAPKASGGWSAAISRFFGDAMGNSGYSEGRQYRAGHAAQQHREGHPDYLANRRTDFGYDFGPKPQDDARARVFRDAENSAYENFHSNADAKYARDAAKNVHPDASWRALAAELAGIALDEDLGNAAVMTDGTPEERKNARQWALLDQPKGSRINDLARKLQTLQNAQTMTDSVTGPAARAKRERLRAANPPTVPMDVPEAVNGRIPIKTMLAKYGGGAMALPISDIEQILMSAITRTNPIAATLAAAPVPGQEKANKLRSTLAYGNATGGW